MNYKYTPTTEAISIVSLELLKNYLRKGKQSVENEKITDIIESSFEYFENQTGYLLRAGSLELQYSYKDAVGYDRRQESSFARTYDSTTDYNDGLDRSQVRFFPPLSGKIDSQKPSAFSFYDGKNNLQELTTTEIEDDLPDNFFFVFNDTTLEFMLKTRPDYPDILFEKQFSEYSTNPIKLTIAVQDRSPVPKDIKQCIIKMACNTYENPDTPQDFIEDSLIQATLQHYNCKTGL